MASQLQLMAELPVTRPRHSSAWSRCEEAVARRAPTATTTCQVCSAAIAQGEWQLGLMFLHVQGFMLMEWYHLPCTRDVPGSKDSLVDLLRDAQLELTPDQRAQFQHAYATK